MSFEHGRRLTVVVCGAGPASDVGTLITAAGKRSWQSNIIATPAALPFLNETELAEATGLPTRSQARTPQTPRDRSVSPPQAVIVAPATFNTVNKLAVGIADNYALTFLAEVIGAGTPVVLVPFVNAALSARAPYQRALELLRGEGVHVIVNKPHPPGTGDAQRPDFPWLQALDAVHISVTG